ncbi:MAG: helix-turn-helix domain-containing protein [Anaerolineae bacterium]
MSQEELITPNEAAAYLKVPVVTVWRWCRQGTLPSVKIGKYWRVDKRELDRFIASSQFRSTSQGKEPQDG